MSLNDAIYEVIAIPENLARKVRTTLKAPGYDHPAHVEVDAAIGRLLAREEVGYIHVRNTEAGCYIARVERAKDGGGFELLGS